jgi:hypothetical protein
VIPPKRIECGIQINPISNTGEEYEKDPIFSINIPGFGRSADCLPTSE